MGYDSTRFEGKVDEELICGICRDVFEDPLQFRKCQHPFCKLCIKEWLSHQMICPVDGQSVRLSQLQTGSRLLRNLLSKLNIECDFESFGCKAIVKLDSLTKHCKECDFNPKKAVPCHLGCDLIIPKDELKDHNCVRDLRIYMQEQRDQISKLQQELKELNRIPTVMESVEEYDHERRL